MLGSPNTSQYDKDAIDKIPFESAVRQVPVGMKDTWMRGGVIGPRGMQTFTVTDISDCPFVVGEPSAAASKSPSRNPSYPSGFPVAGEPPSPTAIPSPQPTISSFPTPIVDPGAQPPFITTLHVNPAPPPEPEPSAVRPPVAPPAAISRNGNSTIPVGNDTITASDPSSEQNSTSTQDPPESQTPISIPVISSTHKSSSTTIPIAHFPPNVLDKTATVVKPAPPPNPKPATTSSVAVDGAPNPSENVASALNNGSLALRPRAVETPFERSNWTWSNSFSRKMKAQITPRAVPKIVNRDQDPVTLIQEAVVCVIIAQIIPPSPPSSPSTSYLRAAVGLLPNAHSPAPPVAAPGLSPSPTPPVAAPGLSLSPPPASAEISPAPSSRDAPLPGVETAAPGFNPPQPTEPAAPTTMLGAISPFATLFDTEPVVTVTDFNTDGQPISTRVVDAAPTTITEVGSDGQPTATRTLDPFTTIVEVNSVGQLVSIVVNDPITTLTELDQSGQPTATIITNVPLTTITLYDSSGLPVSTIIAAVTGQSDLFQSNSAISFGSIGSGSSERARSTTISTRIITISLEAPTPAAATPGHSGAGRSVEKSRMRLLILLVVLVGVILGGLL